MTNNIVFGVDTVKQEILVVTQEDVPSSLHSGDEQDVTTANSGAASDGHKSGIHAVTSLKVEAQNRLEDDRITALTTEMCCQAIAAHEAGKLKLKSD